MTKTLPVTGYTVEINENPSTGQIEDLDDFFPNHTKTTIDENGKTVGAFDKPIGVLQRELNYMKIKTFVKSIARTDGTTVNIDAATIRELPYKDGEALNLWVSEAADLLKKK